MHTHNTAHVYFTGVEALLSALLVMSDQEYDSTDSSVVLEGEESAIVGVEPALEERGERSLEGPSVATDESSGEENEEEEEKGSDNELSESEEPGNNGSEVREEEGETGDEGEREGGEGVEVESSDEETEKSLETTEESAAVSQEKPTRSVKSRAFLDSDDSEGEGEGEGGREVVSDPVEEMGERDGAGVEDVTTVNTGRRKFPEESDDDEINARPEQQSTDSAEQKSRNDSFSQEDVFGGSDDDEEGEGASGKKRKRSWSSPTREDREDDRESSLKRLREVSGSGDEEDEELRQELEELGEEGEGEGEGEGVLEVGGERVVGQREEEEPVSDDEPGPSTAGMSDWDIMIQRRKEAMAKARKRRKRDIDITAVDDHIMAMIREMRQAVAEDKQLNQANQPALKKLKMLPTVLLNLKKSDLQTSFIECGILTVLAEWLTPLPDHSLPHLKIRESILDILKAYPVPESHILKSSRIGKAVMVLYRHPKETRKNKEKAGKIINEWARPIFGLASDFKSLGRDEREERDYANLHQATKRRLSSSSDPKKSSHEEEYEPVKPGDKGWIGRARVPMPSTRDYVVRPKWKAEQEYKRGPSKKVLNRYEKQMNKERLRKMQHKTSHAVTISVEGRKMPL